jgi:hypothetical protein
MKKGLEKNSPRLKRLCLALPLTILIWTLNRRRQKKSKDGKEKN